MSASASNFDQTRGIVNAGVGMQSSYMSMPASSGGSAAPVGSMSFSSTAPVPAASSAPSFPMSMPYSAYSPSVPDASMMAPLPAMSMQPMMAPAPDGMSGYNPPFDPYASNWSTPQVPGYQLPSPLSPPLQPSPPLSTMSLASPLHAKSWKRTLVIVAIVVLVVVGVIFLIRAIGSSNKASNALPRPAPPKMAQDVTVNLAPGSALRLEGRLNDAGDNLRTQLLAMQNDLQSINQGTQLIERALSIPVGTPAPSGQSQDQPKEDRGATKEKLELPKSAQPAPVKFYGGAAAMHYSSY